MVICVIHRSMYIIITLKALLCEKMEQNNCQRGNISSTIIRKALFHDVGMKIPLRKVFGMVYLNLTILTFKRNCARSLLNLMDYPEVKLPEFCLTVLYSGSSKIEIGAIITPYLRFIHQGILRVNYYQYV